MSAARAVTHDISSRFIRGLYGATMAQGLGVKLQSASIAARDFALSLEPTDHSQRLRWLALADTLEAQANSLRAEVRNG